MNEGFYDSDIKIYHSNGSAVYVSEPTRKLGLRKYVLPEEPEDRKAAPHASPLAAAKKAAAARPNLVPLYVIVIAAAAALLAAFLMRVLPALPVKAAAEDAETASLSEAFENALLLEDSGTEAPSSGTEPVLTLTDRIINGVNTAMNRVHMDVYHATHAAHLS